MWSFKSVCGKDWRRKSQTNISYEQNIKLINKELVNKFNKYIKRIINHDRWRIDEVLSDVCSWHEHNHVKKPNASYLQEQQSLTQVRLRGMEKPSSGPSMGIYEPLAKTSVCRNC